MRRSIAILGGSLVKSRRDFSTSSSPEKIVASVLFERLPVVIPKIDPVVYAFQEFSFRWRQKYRRRYPVESLDKSDARQNEQTGLGLDHTINLSDNLGLVLPSSHQMPEEHNDCYLAVIGSSIQGVNIAQIPSSYQHLGGENTGSEPCSGPDASTSEPAALLGNNGRDGVCSPSEPNDSPNEDDDTLSFEN